MIDVILAIADPLVRLGIRILLNEESDICVVKEIRHSSELLSTFPHTEPHLVILDTHFFPLEIMLSIFKNSKVANPKLTFFLLTADPDDSVIVSFLDTTGTGCMLFDEALTMLGDAIRLISKGGTFISRPILRKFTSRLLCLPCMPENLHLSARDLQIMNMLVRAKKEEEMAKELSISSRTLRRYMDDLYDRLGVDCRVEAIVKAVQLNIVEVGTGYNNNL